MLAGVCVRVCEDVCVCMRACECVCVCELVYLSCPVRVIRRTNWRLIAALSRVLFDLTCIDKAAF